MMGHICKSVEKIVGVGSAVGVSVSVTITGKVVSILRCGATGAEIYYVDLGDSVRPFFKDQFIKGGE